MQGQHFDDTQSQPAFDRCRQSCSTVKRSGDVLGVGSVKRQRRQQHQQGYADWKQK
jgi:hypothetical protein